MKIYTEMLPSKNKIIKYTIERVEDSIYIKHSLYFYEIENPEYIEEFYMHIGNVPELLTTIMAVFKTETYKGGFREVVGYGEQINVDMDTERGIRELSLISCVRPYNCLPPFIVFDFTIIEEDISFDPKEREPTKAMTWVMSELEKEYKEWKEDQNNKN
jgi:hypothetical protein